MNKEEFDMVYKDPRLQMKALYLALAKEMCQVYKDSEDIERPADYWSLDQIWQRTLKEGGL